jgi:hypothetical protein
VGPDGFSVDLDALGAARDRVGRFAEELSGPPRDIPNTDVFGHDRLAEAVKEFADREKHGLAQVAGEAESIRDGLAETIKIYRKADDDGVGRIGEITA